MQHICQTADILKTVYKKWFHLCFSSISLIFVSQKETKVLSEALHEMKEENKLLKQKNASMIRKKEHYECEISRLNKVWTRVSHWPGPLPLTLGSLLSSSDTTRCPSFQSWVNNLFMVANSWSPFRSWGNKQELPLANTCAGCSWQVVGLHCKEES